ncbi:hypothetical protein [Psychrobacter sp. AOP31-A1-22]|uniref:hypothetical protein n=1 Tax=Psychrobacter sp. AOP31-A1-22 TaxID=3457696 RepID=UPI0040363EAE
MNNPTQDREFIATQHLELGDNFERVLKETSEKTRNNYFKRFDGLCRRAFKESDRKDISFANGFTKEIEVIEQKRKNGQLKQSSVRQYKAALLYGLTLTSKYNNDNQALNKFISTEQIITFEKIASNIGETNITEAYNRVSGWQAEEVDIAKRLDNEAHLEANTSSTKTKGLERSLYDHLMSDPVPRLELLRLFIRLNIKLGLRPNEWYSCRLVPKTHFDHLISGEVNTKSAETYGLDDSLSSTEKELVKQSRFFLAPLYPDIKHDYTGTDSKRPVLVIKNSKSTHGRANGRYRYILLDAVSKDDLLLLPMLITKLHEKHSEQIPDIALRNKDNFDESVMQPLQKQFKYWLDSDDKCNDILEASFKKRSDLYRYEHKRALKAGKGKDWKRKPPIRLYPTLYSTRHQAVSDAKAAGMSSVVMAALFGHASVVTADRHYGRISDSWGSGMLQPQQYSIDRVIAGLTENQLEAALGSIEPQLLVQAYKEMVQATAEPGNDAQTANMKQVDKLSEGNNSAKALSYIAKNDSGIHQKLSKTFKKMDKAKAGSGSQGSFKRKTPKTRI